jgi:acyl-CoA synthetase (AMP-forming)/AMP-acid ligase II
MTKGLPKPICLTVGGLNTAYELGHLEPENGVEVLSKMFLADPQPMLAATPFFHAMGIVVGMRSVICRSTIVQLPAEKMLSADLMVDVIEAVEPTSAIFPPSILEDMATTTRGMQALGKLERVIFGGAPLSTEIGDKVCRVTHLNAAIGTTECFVIPTLMSSPREDWKYFNWSAAAGADMEPAEDGLCEVSGNFHIHLQHRLTCGFSRYSLLSNGKT